MNIVKLIGIILLFSLSLGGFSSLFAQTDKKAEVILTSTRTKVNSLSNIVASFSKTMELRGSKKKGVSVKGKIKLKKEKFRVELSDQLVICNGKKMWSYLIEDKECTVSDYDPNEGFSPDRLFKLSQSNMKVKYNGSETINNVKTEKVTMFPNDKKSEYFKIEAWIDAVKSLPAQVKIWNRNGSVVTFQISNVDTQANLAETEFNFNSKDYPGVEIINNQ